MNIEEGKDYYLRLYTSNGKRFDGKAVIRLVGEDGQEYVKVKVVEYEMLSVMALEGVKLLRKEFEDFKKQLNNK